MSETLDRDVILKVLHGYIGVVGGFVGELSTRAHADFYPDFCKLDIDPSKFEGSTRDRLIAILETSPAEQQAKILAGVLKKFPVGSVPPRGSEARRSKESATFVEKLIARLNEEAGIATPVAEEVAGAA